MTQIYAPGTPNWVDLGSTDVPGATGFYGSLFGWTVDDLGPEAGGYGIFRKNGRQVAGVGPATDPSRGTSWATYFATDDADDVASKVQANGGQVVMAPMDVMDQGRMAVCTDPTGVFFAVWQAGKHLGAELVNEPGCLTWNELTTTDMAAAKAFYPAVLGVTIRDVSMGEGMTYTLFEVDDRAVAGGMQVDPAGMPTQWSVYFAVDDCDAVHAKAVELGATPVMGPEDAPPGRFAILTDPQGGIFSIIRNNPDFSI
ncbi:MAG: VOC family protein [Actinobacteria bacterium]|nr:MAG: VOC family protein [Actinomycetota bacterium]